MLPLQDCQALASVCKLVGSLGIVNGKIAQNGEIRNWEEKRNCFDMDLGMNGC
jgi:hypothetical protein